jgi:SAM-dependent methyltransferase
MIDRVRDWLTEPMLQGLDPNGADMTVAHRQVLRKKTLLRRVFERFYRECRTLDLRYFGNCPGVRIEIGSGAGFIKDVFPDMLTSDIKLLPFVDLVTRTEHLPFADHSVRALYALNVFHHLPDPRAFLHELMRVLHPGGGAVLLEPYYGPVAQWFFKRLHALEGFDMHILDWKTAHNTGPMTHANQALSYVVFTRDRDMLHQEFPHLEVVLDRPHTQVSYLLSGGVNFRQLIPDALTFIAMGADRFLTPLNPVIALQHTVVLRKSKARFPVFARRCGE